MSKQGLTEILCVIDKSGSMGSLVSDVIGGFNKFIDDQKKLPGEARLTLTLFDTDYKIVHRSKPIADVPDLNGTTYIPGGMTALLDAVGKTISEAGAEFDKRSDAEKPEKVIMVIMTDGCENSSKEHSQMTVKSMIERQQKDWNWEFLYLGANVDAFAEASKLNICASNTANFAATGQNVRYAYSGMSRAVMTYRSGGSASLDSKQY